jgi:hypothetical protein
MPDTSKSPTLDEVWEQLARTLFGKGWSNYKAQTAERRLEDEKATESSVAQPRWAPGRKPT